MQRRIGNGLWEKVVFKIGKDEPRIVSVSHSYDELLDIFNLSSLTLIRDRVFNIKGLGKFKIGNLPDFERETKTITFYAEWVE